MSPIAASFDLGLRGLARTSRALALFAALLVGCTYDFDQFSAKAENTENFAGSGHGGSAAGAESPSTDAGSSGSEEAGAGPAPGSSSGGRPAAGQSGQSGQAATCAERSGTEFGGHCYYRVGASGSPRGASFRASQERCSEGAAHLVTIGSLEEQKAVAEAFFPAESDAWMGLWLGSETPPRGNQCTSTACPWSWTSGEPLTFQSWHEREPNYSGACVRLHRDDGTWVDDDCDRELPAVCERE